MVSVWICWVVLSNNSLNEHMKRLVFFLAIVWLGWGCATKPQAELGYILQVSSGDWYRPNYTTQQIIARLDTVIGQVKVDKVIIGWNLDDEMYQAIGEFLHARNISMLFWLPVFAETEAILDNTPAVDIWGQVPSNSQWNLPEGFRFNCPTNPQNIANLLTFYETHLAYLPFDGVFLDRIRTQSFVCGVQGVLNCGCEHCAARYAGLGVDLAQVRERYEQIGDAFFSVNDHGQFTDSLAARYFEAKGKVVSESVGQVADWFHSRGMEVGMDLFAPLLAPYVGQDYTILAVHADFIKPMLYRQTHAPAGIGYDYELLRKSVPNATGYPDLVTDVAFLNSQLQAMAHLACKKYPGIEINYHEQFAPTTPEYIQESMQAIQNAGFSGAVLSWNIMEAPDAHVRALLH